MISTDIIIIICLVLSAFFSGMEIAFISSNRIQLEIEKLQDGITSKVLKNITSNPSRFIASMLIGNNISLVVYGIFMGDRILQLFFRETLLSGEISLKIVFYQTVISTIIILLTAEFLPKVFFQLYANFFIKIFAIPVSIFYYIFFPISQIILKLTDFILKYFFKTDSDNIKLSFSKVELGNYIDEQLESFSNQENLDSEIEIFKNALDFSDVKAREIMIPRTELICVDKNSSISEIKKLFIKTGLSKILIYNISVDDIIGYVHAFEMFNDPKSLKNILLPVVFIPESMLINEILKTLTRRRKSLAVVIDEYGGTSGIITVEDIVEELFGEIEDEYDKIEHYERKINENKFEFSARLEVDYVNKNYNLSLEESEFYETLGGLIAYKIGEIPKKGNKLNIGNYIIKIKKVTLTKIDRIIIEVNEEE
jgi:CBS domain containing-hemolysin-like protein